MKKPVRVRFAPSPTGPLHIGGVRTALYNYLFAKQQEGTFILRIEDTDQTRYVEGAESYILDALHWLGINPDEGPSVGGEYGPYRQSERKSRYEAYAKQLVETGNAYYAFDHPDELEEMRRNREAEGAHSPKYDHHVRHRMKNSLTLSEEEVKERLASGAAYVIRLKVPEEEEIHFEDQIRGHIRFEGKELDDKVLLKADGMPTYHLANVVDDHEMKISHVIRGEEWLSSTAHHVLLYRAFGWEEEVPVFAHLPLILKPNGKGKLSKRDGQKLGIPVFPLLWQQGEDRYEGFRQMGFLPDAVLNFLMFLGWNPGTEQEIFSLDELKNTFSLSQISKAGARFDYQKALWFNQQYILAQEKEQLQKAVAAELEKNGIYPSKDEVARYTHLFQERVQRINEFVTQGAYIFKEIETYDEKMIRKKWKGDGKESFPQILELVKHSSNFEEIDQEIKAFLKEQNLSFGHVLPLLRLSCCGTMKGPDVFETMKLIGQEKCIRRMEYAWRTFDQKAKS